MAQPTAPWRIIQDATNDDAYVVLSQDPIWNCFALADLEPPMRQYSQFPIAQQDESNESAICLILRHPIIGQVISPFGPAEGIAALLQQAVLPTRSLIQAQETHIPLLEFYYQPETSWKVMWRMAITQATFRPPTHAPSQSIKRLTSADLPALQNLYGQNSENTFAADLFPQGVYVGVYERERLVAAGGTHALTLKPPVAVLGNILSAPAARRQGYGTSITASLATILFNEGFSTVVLNVFEDNYSAIRIYQRLGFSVHRRLFTGQAILLP